jgi:3-dehydroquinate dehydratase
VVMATVAGFGPASYRLALRGLVERLGAHAARH